MSHGTDARHLICRRGVLAAVDKLDPRIGDPAIQERDGGLGSPPSRVVTRSSGHAVPAAARAGGVAGI